MVGRKASRVRIPLSPPSLRRSPLGRRRALSFSVKLSSSESRDRQKTRSLLCNQYFIIAISLFDMTTALTQDKEKVGNLVKTFIEILRLLYSENLNEIQPRLKKLIDEELTEEELRVFKEEFEYAICAIGFSLLFSKIADKVSEIDFDTLTSGFFLSLYIDPLCDVVREKDQINSQHSKRFDEEFTKYSGMEDLEVMKKTILEKVRGADKSDDFFVTTGRDLRITMLDKLLTGATFPLIMSGLKNFLDAV